MVARVLHPDVEEAIRVIDRLGVKSLAAALEADNAEYGAAVASHGQASIRFRVGKLTPSKVGLFVAVWRRSAKGSTEPFPADENVEKLVITVREGTNFGHFVFPKSALIKHGIVSVNGEGGKRGFRVYPPWSGTSNRQATLSQQWQCEYFVHSGDEASRAPATE